MSLKKTFRAQISSRVSWWLSILVVLAALLAPSNLFYSFDQFDWAVRGLRIDYLLPKLYLSDLVLLGIIGVGVVVGSFKKIKLPYFEKLLVIFGVILFARQFFTEFPIAGITQFLRLSLFGVSAWIIGKYWSSLRHTWIWLALVMSTILQGLLSLWQFITQQSLGSYRMLFGEPNLSQSFGIAQGSFGSWGEKILPYGTTAHPNVLAAWLVSSWLMLVLWSAKIKASSPLRLWAIIITGALAVWGVFTTQSFTAFGLLFCGSWYVFAQKTMVKQFSAKITIWLASLALSVMLVPWVLQLSLPQLPSSLTSLPSITRRVFLQTASQTMFFNQPFLGVGLNQFTAHLEATNPIREPVRFDQPVHHIIWLWLSETGLLGAVLVIGTLYSSYRRNTATLPALVTMLWLLFPSLVWDHYLLTQPTGLWIIWFWWLTVTNTPSNLGASEKRAP